ncbi:MAG TPA: alpha/beta hydrolase [Candidatus Angelobacter sp.]|nr:alpha/beta hydrolase [Candidatus Angelobacter sp.]
MNVLECWTKIDGQRIRHQRTGTGPPVLLLHGLLGGSFCWRFSLPVLAQRYTVHAVDLPGAGPSDDRGTDCSMSRQAERLFELIEQMRWQGLTVIGCSFGGAIAMLLAAADARASGRIQSLVLSAPVNPWSDFGQGRIRLLSTALGGYFLRAALPISQPFHRIALRRMYGDPTRLPPDALEGYRASILRPGRAQNVLTALRNWQKDLESLRQIIPQLKIPTLLIWGTRDKAVDPRSAEALRRDLPNAQLKLITGAGHLPFEEVPEEFNRVVMEFLASQDP